LVREVVVTEGLDRVDIYTLIDKKAVRSKEGVHLGFGFNVPQGEMRLDVPWAVVRPELDQIPGACKNWFTVQRWVDVSNRRYGVTWGTPDAPLVQVGGITANLIGSQSNPEAWIEHLPPSQKLYAWVMNNHWHTNYRAEQEGPTLFRFSMLPHGKFRADDAAAFGTGLSQPLLVRPSNKRPLSPKLRVEPASVMVTAFKPSEDGKAYIVRLFGASGKAVMATLRWQNTQPRLWISNLGETALIRAGDKIAVPAYGVVTLRAEMDGAPL
jgi:alpha-mannosidase